MKAIFYFLTCAAVLTLSTMFAFTSCNDVDNIPIAAESSFSPEFQSLLQDLETYNQEFHNSLSTTESRKIGNWFRWARKVIAVAIADVIPTVIFGGPVGIGIGIFASATAINANEWAPNANQIPTSYAQLSTMGKEVVDEYYQLEFTKSGNTQNNAVELFSLEPSDGSAGTVKGLNVSECGFTHNLTIMQQFKEKGGIPSDITLVIKGINTQLDKLDVTLPSMNTNETIEFLQDVRKNYTDEYGKYCRYFNDRFPNKSQEITILHTYFDMCCALESVDSLEEFSIGFIKEIATTSALTSEQRVNIILALNIAVHSITMWYTIAEASESGNWDVNP